MSERPPSDASAAPASERRERLVELGLLAVLGVVLALLEWRHPYYFLQDDNRTAQLGLFAHATRALLAGELPLYNPHQFLGMPSFAVGSVAFLYPPVYAAVLASQGLFGHPDAAIDLLVALHLAVGLVGMSRLLRGLGVSRAGAAFGALTWPLSSMVIYTADSWWNVVGVVAFLPWILHFALRTVRGEGGRGTFAALVVARALLLYLGQVQLFVYAVCFELLCVLLAAPAAAGRRSPTDAEAARPLRARPLRQRRAGAAAGGAALGARGALAGPGGHPRARRLRRRRLRRGRVAARRRRSIP